MWMHHCTSEKKSVQKPQNKGLVRSWQDVLLQSWFKKKEFVLYLFYSVTYGVSSNKISRPPTLCSSISLVPFSSFSAYISATWYNSIPWCISCPGRPLPPPLPVVVLPDPFLDSILDVRDISAIRICTNSWNIPQSLVKMLAFICHRQEGTGNRGEIWDISKFRMICLSLAWCYHAFVLCLHWTIFPAL